MISKRGLIVFCAVGLLWLPTAAMARTVVDYVETFDDADFGGLWGVHNLAYLGRSLSVGSSTTVADGRFKFLKDGDGGGRSYILSTSYPGADNAFPGVCDVAYTFTIPDVATAFTDMATGPGGQLLFCEGIATYSVDHVGVANFNGDIYVHRAIASKTPL